MAFVRHLPAHWKVLLAPAIAFGSWLVSVIGQHYVDKALEEPSANNVMLKAWGGLNHFVAINWVSILGWLIALSLIVLIALTYRDERRLRRVRTLEHWAMHALFLRQIGMDPQATTQTLNNAALWLENSRKLLLDRQAFPPSVALTFHRQGVDLNNARKAVAGMSDQAIRETLIARIDQFCGALNHAWDDYGGRASAPKP
jgi:hypothetical protein